MLKGVRAELGAEYILSLGAGKPPWRTPDGKGSWGGVWGNVMGAAVDNEGYVYLVWANEEGEGCIIKFKPGGGEGDFVQWKQHKAWNWGRTVDIAVDEKYVYVLLSAKGFKNVAAIDTKNKAGSIFVRLDRATGAFAFYDKNRKPVPVGRTYDQKELLPPEISIAKDPRTGRQVSNINSFFYRHPEKREAPPTARFGCNARSIAVGNDRIYITLYLEDKIAVFNAETGEFIKDITGIPRPQGIAVDAAGVIYVASGKKIIKVSAGGSEIGRARVGKEWRSRWSPYH